MASTYTVTRSRTMDAPADRIYALVASFEQWTRWSPWEGIDPDMERRYGGPDAGVGATYAWSGNRKAGAGRMEITRADEPRLVEIALDFTKPFKSANVTSFTIEPRGDDRAEVTWAMTGAKTLVLTLLSPVMSMEKMLGRDFDKGLAQLEDVARPKPAG